MDSVLMVLMASAMVFGSYSRGCMDAHLLVWLLTQCQLMRERGVVRAPGEADVGVEDDGNRHEAEERAEAPLVDERVHEGLGHRVGEARGDPAGDEHAARRQHLQ